MTLGAFWKRLISGSIATILVFCCVMIPYQVSAVNLSIEGLQPSYHKGESIVFYVNVQIEPDERIPIESVSVFIQEGGTYELKFTPLGLKLSGPPWLNVAFISTNGFGYGPDPYYEYDYGQRHGFDCQFGYWYDFGYGYGYSGHLKYEITLDSNGLTTGIYDAWINVKTGSSVHPSFFSGSSHFSLLPADTPPQIVSTYPADGETDIDTGANIRLTFSEKMNTTSVEKAFSLTPTVNGIFLWNDGDDTMLFVTDHYLEEDTNYTVKVSTGAKDYGDKHMATEFSMTFKTNHDEGKETVSDSLEDDGEGDSDTNQTLPQESNETKDDSESKRTLPGFGIWSVLAAVVSAFVLITISRNKKKRH